MPDENPLGPGRLTPPRAGVHRTPTTLELEIEGYAEIAGQRARAEMEKATRGMDTIEATIAKEKAYHAARSAVYAKGLAKARLSRARRWL